MKGEKKKKKPYKQMSKELKYYFKRILKIKWVEKEGEEEKNSDDTREKKHPP